jgi:pectate lyase
VASIVYIHIVFSVLFLFQDIFSTQLSNLSFPPPTGFKMHLLTLSSALLTLGTTASASPLSARAAPVDELVGYAAGTTGGGSAAGTTVTTCAQFATATKAGGVIKVSGTLKDCDIVRIPANTSVLGVGKDAGFEGSGLQIRRVENVYA